MRLVAIFLSFLVLAVSWAEENGFHSLFNGTDLTGWDANPEFWRVEGGYLVGQTTAEKPLKANTYCVWRGGEVDDFELTATFKLIGGNSGIVYRASQSRQWEADGYQADFEAGDKWDGACYAKGRGALATRGQKTRITTDGKVEVIGETGDPAAIQAAVKKEDWNTYRIIAQGNHIQQFINDVLTVDVIDDQTDKRALWGLLALQLHKGPPMQVFFKEIKLKRLPLSDGRKKIVLIAGKNSHGPGAHEFEAGTYALRRCLDKVPGVVATHHFKGWPQHDPSAFDNANALVIYSDGGKKHPVFTDNRLDTIRALAKKGVGVGFMHFGVEVPKETGGEAFWELIGGHYQHEFSCNPMWSPEFKEFPDHEIARGVQPFSTHDEWYFNMRFRDDASGVVPILKAVPSDDVRDGPYVYPKGPYPHILANKGRSETMMWVVDNPGANRGYGYTGGHYHKNWADPNVRKVILNAMLWIARAEVPENGVESNPTDLELNGMLRKRVNPDGTPGEPKEAEPKPKK